MSLGPSRGGKAPASFLVARKHVQRGMKAARGRISIFLLPVTSPSRFLFVPRSLALRVSGFTLVLRASSKKPCRGRCFVEKSPNSQRTKQMRMKNVNHLLLSPTSTLLLFFFCFFFSPTPAIKRSKKKYSALAYSAECVSRLSTLGLEKPKIPYHCLSHYSVYCCFM